MGQPSRVSPDCLSVNLRIGTRAPRMRSTPLKAATWRLRSAFSTLYAQVQMQGPLATATPQRARRTHRVWKGETTTQSSSVRLEQHAPLSTPPPHCGRTDTP
jgi:hypothetical protein